MRRLTVPHHSCSPSWRLRLGSVSGANHTQNFVTIVPRYSFERVRPEGAGPRGGRCSKNLFPNFGTLQSDAVDRSDPNSHFGGDPLPTDGLGGAWDKKSRKYPMGHDRDGCEGRERSRMGPFKHGRYSKAVREEERFAYSFDLCARSCESIAHSSGPARNERKEHQQSLSAA